MKKLKNDFFFKNHEIKNSFNIQDNITKKYKVIKSKESCSGLRFKLNKLIPVNSFIFYKKLN
jgi:hypothetical protein